MCWEPPTLPWLPSCFRRPQEQEFNYFNSLLSNSITFLVKMWMQPYLWSLVFKKTNPKNKGLIYTDWITFEPSCTVSAIAVFCQKMEPFQFYKNITGVYPDIKKVACAKLRNPNSEESEGSYKISSSSDNRVGVVIWKLSMTCVVPSQHLQQENNKFLMLSRNISWPQTQEVSVQKKGDWTSLQTQKWKLLMKMPSKSGW